MKKKIGPVDIFYDLSSIEWSSKLMLKRILSPDISVSFYDERISEDYNMLIKNSACDPMHILKVLNISVINEDFKKYAEERLSSIHIESFSTVFIGNSRTIRRGIKRTMAKGEKFMVVDDLNEKLDLFILKSIYNAKELVCDKEYRSDADSLRKLKV